MALQFRFTLRRAILSTTFVATGGALWPIFLTLPEVVQGGLLEPTVVLCVVLAFALPAAGVGILFSRGVALLFVGVAVGIAIYAMLPTVE